MAETVFKTFVFDNSADNLYPMVLQIIDCVDVCDDNFVLKLKLVLIELLTNSIKHAGQVPTTIELKVQGDSITIRKIDTGNGFAIKQEKYLLAWPLPGRHYSNRVVTVYTDGNAVLKAKLTDNCRLQFFIEELEETSEIAIDNLAEHFGLMIITRASHKFEYEFDIGTCSNNFMVTILKG